jgi:hypothetical protein
MTAILGDLMWITDGDAQEQQLCIWMMSDRHKIAGPVP